jgi:hypothetical protein
MKRKKGNRGKLPKIATGKKGNMKKEKKQQAN